MDLKREFSTIAADVKRAQEGDRAAMDRIIADVQDSVYYTCLSILHNNDAAQDAAQDVLCAIFMRLNMLRNPNAYIGWVNRITANVCKTRLQRSGREVFLQSDEEGGDPFAKFEQVDESAVPDRMIDNAETQRMIVELVNRLPDEQRMCVLLYYYDQMKTREIADALNVSEGTVKSRLNYARKSIKEGVQEYEKQGIKLYGISPIPFIGYFLRSLARSQQSPITPALVRAAAARTAARASYGAASAAAETAAAEVVAEGTKTAIGVVIGRVVTGVLAVGLFAGLGYGVYRMTKSPFIISPSPAPSASPVAETTVTPKPTPEETPEPTQEPTSEPTPEPTPEPSSEPTPEPTPEATPKPDRFSLDAYAAEAGFTAGERMTDKVEGENIICMWDQCYLKTGNYTGDVVVDGVPRTNAMLFYVEYEDGNTKMNEMNEGIPLTGSFELKVPEGYDRLEFMLGAASEPANLYGPPETHGTYCLRVVVGNTQYIFSDNRWIPADKEQDSEDWDPAKEEWHDWKYLSETPIVIDVAGESSVRFELKQKCAKNTTFNEEDYTYKDIFYALNPVIFDVAFTRADAGSVA